MSESVALATQKRNFYKALDNFSTTSSQASQAQTPSAKKRPATAAAAFDEARERASKRLRHSTSNSSLPQKIDSPRTVAGQRLNGDNTSKQPPNYSPWSQETFLARLKTFSSVSLWHPKPDAISEVAWAKRGWVCVDVNTVACRGGCERRVVVSMDPANKAAKKGRRDEEDEGDEEAFQHALAERYRGVIIDGHTANCLWRQGGCKDDIYHLQVVRPSVWQPELKNRFQSVKAISPHIENVKLRPVQGDDIKMLTPANLLKDLPSDIVGDHKSGENSAASGPALEIALHGWRGSMDSNSALLHCDACFQRIGLWMYQPGYHPAGSSSDEDGEDATIIDLVEMHREHCPWRNPLTQRAPGILKGLNACEILQRVVSTHARDHRRRSGDKEDLADQGNGAPMTTAIDESERPVALSREETARQDKERESRLRKIKNLFIIRRRPKSVAKAAGS